MSVESQVAVLAQSVEQQSEVISRLDQNLTKLTDVASNVNKILAVHDEKLSQHEKKQDDIFELIEERRLQMADNIKELHSRITTTTREIGDELNATERRIMAGIDDLKRELKEDQRYHNDKQRSLEDRIAQLEKWRYMLVGAGIVGGFALTHIMKLVDITIK